MEYKIIECRTERGHTRYYIRVRLSKWLPFWPSVKETYWDGEHSVLPLLFESIQSAEDYAVSYIRGLLSTSKTVKRGNVT